MNGSLFAGVTGTFAVLIPAFAIFRAEDAAGGLACAGCMGFIGLIFLAIFALHIALLVWVAKDAKNRGMDSPVIWMILVLVTGLVGFIIYILTRPKGDLVVCQQCQNKRMQVSAKCPHCGNA